MSQTLAGRASLRCARVSAVTTFTRTFRRRPNKLARLRRFIARRSINYFGHLLKPHIADSPGRETKSVYVLLTVTREPHSLEKPRTSCKRITIQFRHLDVVVPPVLRGEPPVFDYHRIDCSQLGAASFHRKSHDWPFSSRSKVISELFSFTKKVVSD
jgi:hypothetical protein